MSQFPYALDLGKAWTAAFGRLPDDYLVFDTETTGLSVNQDYPLQIGWCVVANRKPVGRGSVVLNWEAVMRPGEVQLLHEKLSKTIYHLQKRNIDYDWSVQRMAREGIPPADALGVFADAFKNAPVMAGFNVWRYDIPLLDNWYSRLTGRPMGVPFTRGIDAAGIVKAARSGTLPARGETYRDYGIRAIHSGGNKYKFSLDEFCVPSLGLDRRFGVDVTKMHDASYDSWVTHLVIEDLRRMMEGGTL